MVKKRSINEDYNLSSKQLSQFKEMFPYTRGSELQVKFGLTLNEIQSLRMKYSLVKNRNVYVLPPKDVERFNRDFYNYRNTELMKRFRITRSQLNYLRIQLGLVKRKKRI